MIRKVLTLIVFVLIFSAVPAFAGSADKEKSAVVAAEQWLKGVDAGRYAESWNEAAELFKNAIKQEQWEQSLQAARKPLGKLVSRKIKSKTFATSLPGAPDGEYVVIQFTASFEHKKSAVETVTPMMDSLRRAPARATSAVRSVFSTLKSSSSQVYEISS